MITPQDLEQLARITGQLHRLPRLAAFAPVPPELERMFPGLVELRPRRWSPDRPTEERFDVVLACHTFSRSYDPARWFHHVLRSCRFLVFVDAVRSQRGASSELGGGEDRLRFSVGNDRARIAQQFSLSALGDRLLAHHTYSAGASALDRDPVHVIALVRGDLAEPVLRIDDYPTGIRPLLPDLAPLHAILEEIDRANIAYYLGIVPTLLTDAMASFLAKLDNMIPAVHGYDHAYPHYSAVLERANDPFNHDTVGVFNEFRGMSYAEIVDRLARARQILIERCGRGVDAYIPACNIGDRKTGRALLEAGYDRYLSEKRIPGCELPWIKSDFYGRSSDYHFGKHPDVITLHVTWEWDVRRTGAPADLDRLLKHLAARCEHDRAVASRLRQAFA